MSFEKKENRKKKKLTFLGLYHAPSTVLRIYAEFSLFQKANTNIKPTKISFVRDALVSLGKENAIFFLQGEIWQLN